VTKPEAPAANSHHAVVPSLEMVDTAQQGALPGPAGAEQCDDLADADRQVEAVKHDLVAIAFAQSADFYRNIVARQPGGPLGLVCRRCLRWGGLAETSGFIRGRVTT